MTGDHSSFSFTNILLFEEVTDNVLEKRVHDHPKIISLSK